MLLIIKSFLIAVLFLLSFIISKADHYPKQKMFSSSINLSIQNDDDAERSLMKPMIYSFSLMAVNFAVLVGADLAVDKIRWSNFKRAFTSPPVFDEDGWVYNYFLHPLMGSESYLRAREGGFGYFGSFLFSTAMSFSWEYIIESWTEQPSIQDLLITSTTGSLLGELRYRLKNKMKPKHHWMIDPINSLYLGVSRSFKKEPRLSFGFQLVF